MTDRSQTTDYPPLTFSMIEAFLDWDVARVNSLIERGEPRSSSEWRITDNHVKQFYKLMMEARHG